MSDAKALAEIQRLARVDRIRFTKHAQDRMDERRVNRGDVRNALVTARAAAWQRDHETRRVTGGSDLDGDDLECVVALEADVVAITVF